MPSNRKILQTSAIPSDKPARGLGKLFCTGRAPHEATLLGNCAQQEITASLGMKSITKGLKTLPITQVDKVRWREWPDGPILQKSSKTARVHRFLLRAVIRCVEVKAGQIPTIKTRPSPL